MPLPEVTELEEILSNISLWPINHPVITARSVYR